MSAVSRTYSEAIERIRDAIERASATGRRNMNAMSLATVDGTGSPSVRHVLLKSIDDEGLRFFTDARSEKAQNLAGNPRASVCFYWEPIEEQARVDGTVVRLSDEEVAADFAARPRAGQIMIQVSAQSQPLDSPESLRAARDAAEARLPDPIPCPSDWIGFRLEPDRVEHWQGSRDRVHTRTVVARVEGAWSETLLQP
ncbi:MAG: pyridoxal 5'-phosphate synthase [bacterium]|nr:pyridoxal 5'-phosphate synthase [bacterium]